MGTKQSFYESHYDKSILNFMSIELKTWDEVRGVRACGRCMCACARVLSLSRSAHRHTCDAWAPWPSTPIDRSTYRMTRLPNLPHPHLATQIKWQAHLERSLFRHEWRWILGVLAAEYFNLVMHNLVYWCALSFLFLGGRGTWDVDMALCICIRMHVYDQWRLYLCRLTD